MELYTYSSFKKRVEKLESDIDLESFGLCLDFRLEQYPLIELEKHFILVKEESSKLPDLIAFYESKYKIFIDKAANAYVEAEQHLKVAGAYDLSEELSSYIKVSSYRNAHTNKKYISFKEKTKKLIDSVYPPLLPNQSWFEQRDTELMESLKLLETSTVRNKTEKLLKRLNIYFNAAEETCAGMLTTLKNSKISYKEFISKATKRIQKLKNIEKSARLKAYENKAREGTSTIKVQLKEQLKIFNNCPYCNKEIDFESCHADHIYPIAKGGLSVKENIILVCPTCNNKKSKLTLRQFVKKENFNMQEIEGRLEMLGKDF